MPVSTPPAFDARLAAVERQMAWWRIAALVSAALIGVLSVSAFRQPSTRAIEGDSLTLRGPQGASVTLAITVAGDLEARFARSAAERPQPVRGSSLVLIDPSGHVVARLGGPTTRPAAQ